MSASDVGDLWLKLKLKLLAIDPCAFHRTFFAQIELPTKAAIALGLSRMWDYSVVPGPCIDNTRPVLVHTIRCDVIFAYYV
jgi:hypothetical protein